MAGDADEVLIGTVVSAIEAGRADDIRLLLHPYLHWTTADGSTVRGRRNVLALLAHDYPVGADRSAEIRIERRDGQIYRWSRP